MERLRQSFGVAAKIGAREVRSRRRVVSMCILMDGFVVMRWCCGLYIGSPKLVWEMLVEWC